eukprot:3161968-Prymnesium_polylepis.1
MPQDRRALAERLAGMEAELLRVHKEATEVEVQQAEAFNSVVRALEGEVRRALSAQRSALTAALNTFSPTPTLALTPPPPPTLVLTTAQ